MEVLELGVALFRSRWAVNIVRNVLASRGEFLSSRKGIKKITANAVTMKYLSNRGAVALL